jgi:hypothetical protein
VWIKVCNSHSQSPNGALRKRSRSSAAFFEKWIPFSYDVVANLLDDLLAHKKSSLNPNIYSFISQYQTILRRYVVGDSEVERIAKEIYKKHKTCP